MDSMCFQNLVIPPCEHKECSSYENFCGMQSVVIIGGHSAGQYPCMYQPYAVVQQTSNLFFYGPIPPSQYPRLELAWRWAPHIPSGFLFQNQLWNSSLQDHYPRREELRRISDSRIANDQRVSQRVNGRRLNLDHIVCRKIQREDIESLGEGYVCVICMDQFKAEQDIRQPSCNHVFHKTCADKWFAFKLTCPLCATNLSL
eukprot:TRINITY_DN13891_c0_g1_i2.p2 TRINITY_DN13891_c0_g1~~TRINITY_DN13891_c0_g1_i2.p2  ORF type:complete len:201 (-),score=-0.60 TRINITY_DN13891_c0_g1_i2:1523-2125(-)